LTTGSAGYAAGVCTLWGVAVGLSALRSDGPAGTDRPARVAAAAGCELLGYWLLLASRQVAVLEAYTLPAAGLAVLAGWLAARRRPQLHSWTAYGPALLAGFGPSAVTLLGMDGPPLRRLALGAAALAVVVGGAVRRRPLVPQQRAVPSPGHHDRDNDRQPVRVRLDDEVDDPADVPAGAVVRRLVDQVAATHRRTPGSGRSRARVAIPPAPARAAARAAPAAGSRYR